MLEKTSKLGVVTKSPKVAVSCENKRYLQILDVLDILNKAPVDADNPHKLIAELIKRLDLSYGVLLALAGKYYNENTVRQLAKTAVAGGMIA